MKNPVLLPILCAGLAMVACSHEKTHTQTERNQQAGQVQQKQSISTQTPSDQASSANAANASASNESQAALGEQSVTSGMTQIQRQKKVVSTVIVRDKIPTVKESTVRADINKMNAKQFTAIGFPSDVSNNIVQYRDRNGPFKAVGDLANVEGVSQSMIDRYGASLGVSGSQGAKSSSAAGISGQDSSLNSSSSSSELH